MARWQEVIDTAPEFAERSRALFDAYKHKTMATLRKDGSPRISGIEVQFSRGEAWLGMMPGSLKLADVLRDPRIALHSASMDGPEKPESSADWPGDTKLSGRLVQIPPELLPNLGVTDESPEGIYFRIDLEEVVTTRLGEPPDHLLISLWRPGKPLRETKRF